MKLTTIAVFLLLAVSSCHGDGIRRCKMAARGEPVDIADESDQSRRGQ